MRHTNKMTTNWSTSDYFSMLLNSDKRGHAALEMLVDDLHADKEKTISKFLFHSGSEDFLWGLVRLLGNKNSRVAGNAAYILGTLAENEAGCMRVISLTSGPRGGGILDDLTKMLTFDDSESVMNAAGTMGTLAESHEGRAWMLREACLNTTVSHITALLTNENLWTASNAALVLARLTIAEEGCDKLLNHDSSDYILSRLINSLGVDEAGRGMNAAFAIGRLCDLETGRSRLLALSESERMITSLAKMLCCTDTGASKNACFALSCLATNKDGHNRLLKNAHSDEVIKMLSLLLAAQDPETGWFAAMTLRTLASQPRGCLRLRDHPNVVPALKLAESQPDANPDLREEVMVTIDILRRLEKPAAPDVEVLGPSEVDVRWEEVTTKCGFPVSYHLYNGSKCVYSGKQLSHRISGLAPHTQYSFRLRTHTEGDDSPLSEPVTVTTEEDIPEAPQNLRILGVTTTQLKVGWEPPENICGHLKSYHVYNGKNQVEQTVELCSIISGLQPNTAYDIHVCASTIKGKGPQVSVMGTTAELGAHAPSKPDITVRGRNELCITWKPPEVPLGRISRYDLSMNGKVIYSGTELCYIARRLTPDTEYTFIVSAITSEGKCESKPTKKKTAKDEYEGERAPLYQPPPKKEPDKPEKDSVDVPKTNTHKRRRTQGSQPDSRETSSAKPALRNTSPSGYKQTRTKSATHVIAKLSYQHASKKEAKNTPYSDKENSGSSKPSAVAAGDGFELQQKENAAKSLSGEIEKVTSKQSSKTMARKASDSSEGDLRPDRPRRSSKASRRPSLLKGSKPSDPDTDKESTKAKPERVALAVASGEDFTDTLTSVKRGNEILTVEVHSRKSQGPERRRSREGDVRKEETGARRLGPRRNSSVEVPLLDPQREAAKPQAFETDPAWMEHAQKYENQEITRMFSTMPMNTMYTVTQARPKPGFIELELPPSTPPAPQVTTTLGPRQNTPSSSRSGRRQPEKLTKPSPPPPPPPPHQWSPDFPSHEKTMRNHNKFVPMQFRTQPVNLPGSLRREATSIYQDKGRRMDGFTRSQTELDMGGHMGANASFTLTPNRFSRDRIISANTFPGQMAGQARRPMAGHTGGASKQVASHGTLTQTVAL